MTFHRLLRRMLPTGEGWLSRRFPPGASEEEFELTAEAASALRFVNSIIKPRVTATESRLSNVIQQLARLAEDTDANPKTRMAALVADRNRIDAEIRALDRGGVRTLPDERAREMYASSRTTLRLDG